MQEDRIPPPGWCYREPDHPGMDFDAMDWIMRGLIERAGFVIEREEQKEGFLGLYLCKKV